MKRSPFQAGNRCRSDVSLPLTVPAGMRPEVRDALQSNFTFVLAIVMAAAIVGVMVLSVPSSARNVPDTTMEQVFFIIVGGTLLGMAMIWLLNPYLERRASTGMLTIDQSGLKLQIEGRETVIAWRTPIQVRRWLATHTHQGPVDDSKDVLRSVITTHYEVWELTQDTVQITLSRKIRDGESRRMSRELPVVQEKGLIVPQKADEVFETLTRLGTLDFSARVVSADDEVATDVRSRLVQVEVNKPALMRNATGVLVIVLLCAGLAIWAGWAMGGTFFRDLFNLPVRYECLPREDDPEGYLVALCEYVVEHQIRTANPTERQIVGLDEFEFDGREVISILLDCCGQTGDSALIDKETGEVIQYTPGPNVY